MSDGPTGQPKFEFSMLPFVRSIFLPTDVELCVRYETPGPIGWNGGGGGQSGVLPELHHQ